MFELKDLRKIYALPQAQFSQNVTISSPKNWKKSTCANIWPTFGQHLQKFGQILGTVGQILAKFLGKCCRILTVVNKCFRFSHRFSIHACQNPFFSRPFNHSSNRPAKALTEGTIMTPMMGMMMAGVVGSASALRMNLDLWNLWNICGISVESLWNLCGIPPIVIRCWDRLLQNDDLDVVFSDCSPFRNCSVYTRIRFSGTKGTDTRFQKY